MVLVPDPRPRVIDPFHEQPTMSIICNVIDPITREPYSRDPRYVAQKAEGTCSRPASPTPASWAPRPSSTSSTTSPSTSGRTRRSTRSTPSEGYWNRGAGFGSGATNGGGNLGYKLRSQEGYFPAPPADTHGDLRARMVVAMEAMGIDCEFHHHEVGAAGQAEIDLRFHPLLQMADKLQLHKYVVKNVARQAGKIGDVHAQADLRGERLGHARPPVAVEGRRERDVRLRRLRAALARGAELHRRPARARPALMAFCAPTTNSYRRLVPGYEAPVNLVYSPAQPLGRGAHPGVLGRRRRPSASSSARRTRPPTRTWRSRRC